MNKASGLEEKKYVNSKRSVVRAFLNKKTPFLSISMEEEAYGTGTLPHQDSQQFMFLNKALLSPDDSKEDL